MGIDTAMTANKLATAKAHVYNICNQGDTVTLIKPGTKDELGEILTESTQDLKAFPIRFVPFDRKTAERIAWIEEVDVVCYISQKALDNLSLTVEKIRRYKEMKHNNKRYDLRYVEPYCSFANDFLYTIIGGKRRR